MRVAGVYGEALVEDLGEVAAQENLPPTFNQRALHWLDKYAQINPIANWEKKVFNSGEDWLRKHLNEAVLDGRIDPQIAAGVGFFWGLVKTCKNASDSLLDPTAATRMGAELMATVVRAISGDAEAKQSLLEMLPVYGTYRSFADAYASWESGNYFDSGTQIFSRHRRGDRGFNASRRHGG